MRILLAIALTLCSLATAQAQSAVHRLTADPRAAQMAAVVHRYAQKGEFSGAVLVAQRGRIIYASGAGMANSERNVLNTPDTAYPICSITKQMTAVLVLQQAAAGVLSLEAPISRYLPDFPASGSNVTLEQLLTHTSGLLNTDDVLPDAAFYARPQARYSSPAFVIDTYLNTPLVFTPGAKFSYNNADYLVLQAILERVTQKPFAQLLRDNLFVPSGMTHSGLIVADVFAPRQAVGYAVGAKTRMREPYYHYANFGAAGAVYSTARDMMRWNAALDSGLLLPAAWQERLFQPVPGLGYEALSTWTYAAPFKAKGVAPLLNERDGAIGAFQTLSLRAPQDGYSVIVLANTDTTRLGHIYERSGLAYDLLRVLYSLSVPPAK